MRRDSKQWTSISMLLEENMLDKHWRVTYRVNKEGFEVLGLRTQF